MPGTAYQFEVLAGVTEALKAAGDPRGEILEKNAPFAHLGALGPDLFRYTFIDDAGLKNTVADVLAGTTDPNTLNDVDKLALHRDLLMVTYGTVFERFQGLWPVLEHLHDFLDRMSQIASDEDQDALEDIKDEADDIQTELAPLTGIGDAGTQVYDAISQLVSLYRPNIQADSATANAFQTQPLTWRQSEFLRWRGSGRLARNILRLAREEPDGDRRDQMLAFAYGWMSHIAASVTGEPLVDNIVGGPYRSHWWRNRFIQNYVDTWTWGKYHTSGATMSGDTPTPPYGEWADPCRAHFEDRIQFEGSPNGDEAVQAVIDGVAPEGALPTFIADLLAKAIEETYQGEIQPLPPGSFSASRISNAYVGAVSVLYFMTGGKAPMCTQHPGAPPSDCTDPPDWVGSGGSPPETDPDDFVDSDKKATKIILAILAVLFFLGGAIGAGIAAAVGSANTDPVKWNELRCHIYWLRYFLFQAEKGIRDMLTWGTLAYPASEDLATAVTDGPPDGPAAATAYCRTRTDSQRYPKEMAADEAAQFTSYPSSATEQPATRSWPRDGDYPSVALDDASFTPVAGDMTDNDPANFPTKMAADDVAWFGNSVLNALAVISKDAEGLVDYNLDGDRGYGWMAWKHPVTNFPSDPPFDTDPA